MHRLSPTLQWTCYHSPEDWPQSNGRAFLAEAVQLIGAATCLPWNGPEPSWMLNALRPEVPPVYQAFDEARKPIPEVHRAYADKVRSIKSPATYAAERMSETEWVRSCVPDPEGGEPLPALLLRARCGKDRNDAVTFEHWEDASILTAQVREELCHAELSLKMVSRALQTAIIERRIPSFMRSIGGNLDGAESIPISWWEIDDPLPRLAWCGLNAEVPLDPDAHPTHWIFVDRPALMAELSSLEPVLLVDPGPAPEKLEGYSEKIINEVSFFLIEEFKKAPRAVRKAEFLRRAQDARGAHISETNLRAAWKIAAASDPRRSRPGRPDKRSSSLIVEISPEI